MLRPARTVEMGGELPFAAQRMKVWFLPVRTISAQVLAKVELRTACGLKLRRTQILFSDQQNVLAQQQLRCRLAAKDFCTKVPSEMEFNGAVATCSEILSLQRCWLPGLP
jgi:hypothetical protein